MAVPFSLLVKRRQVVVTVDRRRFVVRVTGDASSPLAKDDVTSGRSLPSVEVRDDGRRVAFDTPFWFAVAAFRPDVVVVRR